MRIAYFDCHSGISGDMTLGALIDAGANIEAIRRGIHSMGLADVEIGSRHVLKKGFRGLQISITHPPEKIHRNLFDITSLLNRANCTTAAKNIACRLFERIAIAESKVHNTSIDRVHFHEIGAIDSIVDIVGTAIAWDDLKIERAVATPIPTGAGSIQISHGLVAIPAPATAELLTGIPIAPCSLPFEMTTPTGAAIIAELVENFGPMPSMQVGRIGYGAGQREMPDRPNLLRVLIGHTVAPKSLSKSDDRDSVCILETNLDDLSGEQIGFAIDMIWKAGALDVYTVPIQMKKNRPGFVLTVICRPEDKSTLEATLFRHTGTLGVRHRKQNRTVLPRANIELKTEWGRVNAKVSMLPTGEIDCSPEYEDCRRIAIEQGLRLTEVIAQARACYFSNQNPHTGSTGRNDLNQDVLDQDHKDGEFALSKVDSDETGSSDWQLASWAGSEANSTQLGTSPVVNHSIHDSSMALGANVKNIEQRIPPGEEGNSKRRSNTREIPGTVEKGIEIDPTIEHDLDRSRFHESLDEESYLDFPAIDVDVADWSGLISQRNPTLPLSTVPLVPSDSPEASPQSSDQSIQAFESDPNGPVQSDLDKFYRWDSHPWNKPEDE